MGLDPFHSLWTSIGIGAVGNGNYTNKIEYNDPEDFDEDWESENEGQIENLEQEIEQLKIKRKTALMKFLNADKIGILVSTKPGQENMKQAQKIKEKLAGVAQGQSY